MQIFERIRRKLRGARDTMASYERQIRDLRSPKRAPKTEKGKQSIASASCARCASSCARSSSRSA